MPVPILCLIAVIFLMWVVYLKSEISRLRNENERLKRVLKDKVERFEGELNISGSRRLPVSKFGIVTEKF